jgi:hypothetical protein
MCVKIGHVVRPFINSVKRFILSICICLYFIRRVEDHVTV